MEHMWIERGNIEVILNEKTRNYENEKDKCEDKALQEKKVFWYIATFIASIVSVIISTAMRSFGIFLFGECLTQIIIFIFMDITMDKVPKSLELSHKISTLNIYSAYVMSFKGNGDNMVAKYEITYAEPNGNRKKIDGLVRHVKFDENIRCNTLDLTNDEPVFIQKTKK